MSEAIGGILQALAVVFGFYCGHLFYQALTHGAAYGPAMSWLGITLAAGFVGGMFNPQR